MSFKRSQIVNAFEMRVAETAIAAARDAKAVSGFDQIGDDRFLVLSQHFRSGRNLDRHVLTVCAGAVAAHAVDAAFGLEMLLITVVDERVEVLDALDPDVAALAAVAAVGAAELDEFFAPEADAPVTAVAGLDVDFRQIEEFHAAPRQRKAVIGRFLS